VILPCIVNIFLWNSPVIACLCYCSIIRSITALLPVTEEYIVYLEQHLPLYAKYCSVNFLLITLVSFTHTQTDTHRIIWPKINYPKHHFLFHIPFDLHAKGSTNNYTTLHIQVKEFSKRFSRCTTKPIFAIQNHR